MFRSLALAFVSGAFFIAWSINIQAAERPNFLFILGDNLGKDWFGCYGADEGQTPTIDKLAATGVRFQHCYVTPLCSTTRAELWTGRYGLHTGWQTHHDAGIYGGGGLDRRREITMARLLKSAGYATALGGKWQINDLYEQPDALTQHGFDEHLVWTGALVGEGTGDARWKASLSEHELESRYWNPISFRNGRREELTGRFGPDVYADFLVDFMARHRDQPFLAFYSAPLTHVPTIAVPGVSKDAADREQYKAMVRYLDTQVGRLIGELERLGLREKTIVVFTTDNGSSNKYSGSIGGRSIRGGLGTLSEPGLDVPLVVNCPARVTQGRVCDALVDCSDFFPTLADLAGAKLPPGVPIDGHSFAPQLDGGSNPPPGRDWIFTQYAGTRVVRDHQFKLYSTGALYDVEADPTETKNLADSREPEVVAANRKLHDVLASLPADAVLPFKPRSASAFQLEAGPKVTRPKPAKAKPAR